MWNKRDHSLQKSWRCKRSSNSSVSVSPARSIAQQRSRIVHLREGDANTRYFQLLACHRSQKSFIDGLVKQASTSVIVGNGSRPWFWRDKWIDGRSIESLAPDLMCAVDKRVISVRTIIVGSMTFLARFQRSALSNTCCCGSGSCKSAWCTPQKKDSFVWKWSSSSQFTASSAYQVFLIG
jgi:hypothetical protein